MISQLKLLNENREDSLKNRYVCNDDIMPLLDTLKSHFKVSIVGYSVKKRPVFSVTLGSGPKKILIWSQMHGNETTTTKALFDIFNYFKLNNNVGTSILQSCTMTVIPILNPDGASLYTRLNANNIDLNRDAQDLSQPESLILDQLYKLLQPDFCFNLHGQRTIFSAGNTKYPATISFLAPSQNFEKTITHNRKSAMKLIARMNQSLQSIIPLQVGLYDDAFNLNCVGDTFQSKNTPTILIEAGHYHRDYRREHVRKFICVAILEGLSCIAKEAVSGHSFDDYFKIPLNKKLFFDVIIRNTKEKTGNQSNDIGIQFKEVLIDNTINFVPIIKTIGNLSRFYGHYEIDANFLSVTGKYKEQLQVGSENDFVLINNELFALKPDNY
ncbi:MAG: DUF2817 domain-containing protein [Bacteroidetes bacterium]|nr:DUF2817 domain-containing protein [Bacteroidota bacterium]